MSADEDDRRRSGGLSGEEAGEDDWDDLEDHLEDEDDRSGAGTSWFEREDNDGLEEEEDLPDALSARRRKARRRAAPPPETRVRRPSKPLPLRDDAPVGRGRAAHTAKTPFREEDENKELRGCMIFLVAAVVLGGGAYLLRDAFDFSDVADLESTPSRPPITHIEGMKEKTVVDTTREAGAPLARKLTAPEEDDGGAAGKRQVTTAAIMDIANSSTTPTVTSVLEQVEARSVCYDGRPARRVPGLYGLEGGFGVSYGLAPTDNPRLEFLPPKDDGRNVLHYVSFVDGDVRGFEGNQARVVPNNPKAVARVVLAWVAEVANGDCP